LLWSYDDGDWVALVLEDVDGRTPTLPWRREDWQRVHDAVVDLAETLTPNPVGDVRRLADHGFSGWRSLAVAGHGPTDPWARANIGRLVDLEQAWPSAVDGNTLVHMDIRADNIVLTEDRVVFVDWPHASVGAPWADLLFMLPSVASQDGPDPAEVWSASPLAAGADDDAVNAALAGVAGFFVHSATLPPPKNLDTVRGFQRVQGSHALRWLESRLS
jgi:aminoglycoside phosphotransferase (APT) family kinase protein